MSIRAFDFLKGPVSSLHSPESRAQALIPEWSLNTVGQKRTLGKQNQTRCDLSCSLVPPSTSIVFNKTGGGKLEVGQLLAKPSGSLRGYQPWGVPPLKPILFLPCCCDKHQPKPAGGNGFRLNSYFSPSVREAGAGTQSRYLEAEAMENHSYWLSPRDLLCLLSCNPKNTSRQERKGPSLGNQHRYVLSGRHLNM